MSKCFPNVRAARGQVDSRVMIDERRTFSDDVVASSFLGHFRKLVFGRTALCCLLNAFAEATRSNLVVYRCKHSTQIDACVPDIKCLHAGKLGHVLAVGSRASCRGTALVRRRKTI